MFPCSDNVASSKLLAPTLSCSALALDAYVAGTRPVPRWSFDAVERSILKALEGPNSKVLGLFEYSTTIQDRNILRWRPCAL